MSFDASEFKCNKFSYRIRTANVTDAVELSELRVRIDSETEFLDREPGEDFLSKQDYVQLISDDLSESKSLFLVVDVGNKIVGYTRCIGQKLSRFSHQAEFGICIQRDFWGYGIGKQLLTGVIEWADKLKELMPEEYMLITIDITGKSSRRFRFIPHGKQYEDIVSRYFKQKV